MTPADPFDHLGRLFAALNAGSPDDPDAPLAITLPADALDAPLPPVWADGMRAAAALEVTGTGPDVVRCAPMLLSLVETFGVALALRLSSPPDRPEELVGLNARLVVESTGHAAEDLRPLVAAGFPLLQLRHRAPAAAAVDWLGALEAPHEDAVVQVRLRAPHPDGLQAYAERVDALRTVAEERGFLLDLPGAPDASWPGLPRVRHDASLLAATRALFATFPAICPFPFTMARRAPDGVGLCPRPDGPVIPEASPLAAFHSEEARGVRGEHQRGCPPAACERCPLPHRLHRSLAATSPYRDAIAPAQET